MKIAKNDIRKVIRSDFLHKLSEIYLDRLKIDKHELTNTIFDNLSKNQYTPSQPQFIVDYDKGHGIVRCVPVFNSLDYSIYSFCVLSLDSFLATNRTDGTYGGWSMSNRFRKKEVTEADVLVEISESESPFSNTFNPQAYIEQYGEYNARIKNLLFETPSRFPHGFQIVSLDIANFYDHVRLDLLENNVRMVSDKKCDQVIDLLFYFLRNWNKQINTFQPQSVGLPQELIGDCSRILANFYLQPYDELIHNYCAKNGISYLRYSDDQLFFVPSNFNYKKLLRRVSIELSKLGLNVNPKKVKLWLESAEFTDFKGYNILGHMRDGVFPKDQGKDEVNAVAVDFLVADKSKLAKRGGSILKTIIAMGVNKLSTSNRRAILKLVYSEYLPTFQKHQLQKIYNSLTKSERSTFLRKLNASTKNNLHNSNKYEVFKFAQKNRLYRFKRYKHEILNSQDWIVV